MPSSSEVAKAKYQAMLEQAKINNAHHRTNRVVTTRHPSTGGCEITNSISRRTSHSSMDVPTGRFRAFIKNLVSPPAY
ncbi:hypothetical protein ISF_08569 [Cordyceps fumosorosea ARSEF 2679]|uniref:Uncharacterized protein n=1 Tax=Cordyceps fumosorosea (strain ARSEF 2679) TaxID=1081104 RepID=A0A167M3D8_CORFA|nr:hypothetical protein ISF_08569 [Cordyceps fumosorosea ARSEF 2679]OAA53867.1 hypothetical protein ISF_08569 [Cordyceps fumosorosea ARSEF 2679]